MDRRTIRMEPGDEGPAETVVMKRAYPTRLTRVWRLADARDQHGITSADLGRLMPELTPSLAGTTLSTMLRLGYLACTGEVRRDPATHHKGRVYVARREPPIRRGKGPACPTCSRPWRKGTPA